MTRTEQQINLAIKLNNSMLYASAMSQLNKENDYLAMCKPK